MSFAPANAIQDILVFGEHGGVNPSIEDSATFTFMSPETMEEMFESGLEGCFLYARHYNPNSRYLAQALSRMEGTESGHVTASGMSAIGCTLLQLCRSGDEIVAARTIYGGTYALLKNFLPRLGITTRFVDITNHDAVRAAITDRTRVLYTETVSNPLLEVADLPTLAEMAHQRRLTFVVDNTFTPLIFTPAAHGADVVVYSLTKFINGTSDAVGGALCARQELVDALMSVNDGAAMLLGPVLDTARSASMLKNLHSLHLRMRAHSRNGLAFAERLASWALPVHYPGLAQHPQHALMRRLMHPEYGFGGMVTLDVGSAENANRLMKVMQEELVGYLAVSLGFYKTLFSAPGHSTSSEIPTAEQQAMGLSQGLIRFSVGLDEDIERTLGRLEQSLRRVGLR